MKPAWLLVDANNLCWRAFHTTGGLSHEGFGTGVCFGILRDLEHMTGTFGVVRTVLAFDGIGSLRQDKYPNYKSERRGRVFTDAERKARESFYEEIRRLRTDVLPAAGYNNVFAVDGFEADDIIAKVAEELPESIEGIIASTDKDLYQCLRENVIIYNPIKKEVTSLNSFSESHFGIHPKEWANVKAIAGCDSDSVVGVRGVGDITAAKWVAGKLKHTSKTYQEIQQNYCLYRTNLPLVALPYPGLVLPEIRDDAVTPSKITQVREALGIRQRPVRRTPPDALAGRGFDIQ